MKRLTVITVVAMLAVTGIGFTTGFCVGHATATVELASETKVDLPEEFMCVVSDTENQPDTVLAFQSRDNDSLFIRFK